MNRPPALPQPGRNFWRAVTRASLISLLLWAGIALAVLPGCAVPEPQPPVTVVEPVCWDMTKRWHFKQGCNVHSAWRYQIEI